MRIVHVTDSFPPRLGGIERQVDELSRRQALAGHDVTVVCGVAAGAAPAGAEDAEGLVVVRPHDWDGTQVAYHRAGRTLERVDLAAADVVHVHVSVFSPLAALALQRAADVGVPVVVTVHSLWRGLGGALAPLGCGALSRAGRHATWTAVSRVAADEVARRLHTDVAVLPNGIDAAFWRAVAPRPEPGVLRIAAVMRLTARKRPLALLDVVAAVRARLPAAVGLRACVVGDGPLRATVAEQARRRGLQHCVELAGPRTSAEIRDVFARSDVFVAPARLESFGIAALEARCAGLPVVALAGSGVADVIEHGRTGWLAADDAGLADALAAPAVRYQNRWPGRQGEACRFDWDTVIARTADVYERVGARRPARVTVPAR